MQGDKDNAVAVPFSDDEAPDKAAEELDDDAPSSASPEERVLRKQRRQDRIKRILDEGKQNADRVKTLESEQARLTGELERMKGFMQAQQQRQPAPDAKDPYEAQLDAVYERQAEAYNAAQAEIKAGTFTDARQKHYEKIAREVESDKTRIHTNRAVAQQSRATSAEAARQVWVQKYPEVYNNQQAYQFAEATYNRRKAIGEDPSPKMVEEIMAETMTQFKLGPKTPPSASERSRMSGMSSAGGGGGGPRGGGIHMTNDLKRMAHAAYSHLSPAEAEKAWVNGPGKKLREKRVL